MSQLYKVHFRRATKTTPAEDLADVVDKVSRAAKWLRERNLSQHFVNWYDNKDDVVFVLTDRDTAIAMKLSL